MDKFICSDCGLTFYAPIKECYVCGGVFVFRVIPTPCTCGHDLTEHFGYCKLPECDCFEFETRAVQYRFTEV